MKKRKNPQEISPLWYLPRRFVSDYIFSARQTMKLRTKEWKRRTEKYMGENPFHGNQVSLHMGTPYKIRVWFCTILRTPSTSLCSISILFAAGPKEKKKIFWLVNQRREIVRHGAGAGLECIQNTKSLYWRGPNHLWAKKRFRLLDLFRPLWCCRTTRLTTLWVKWSRCDLACIHKDAEVRFSLYFTHRNPFVKREQLSRIF